MQRLWAALREEFGDEHVAQRLRNIPTIEVTKQQNNLEKFKL